MAPIDSSTKMPPVTVYVLKKDRLALLDDITDIIKDENIILTSRCIDKLEDCLNAKLEPTSIPYDPKDPDRAINMATSTRLRGVKAAGIVKGVTTSKHTAKSYRRPDFMPYTRFRKFGGPRNVYESFMDRDFIPPDGAPENDYDDEDEDEDRALAIAEAAKHRLESRDTPATNTNSRFGGPRNMNESFINTANLVRNTTSKNNPSSALRASKKAKINASLAYQPPSKKDSFEHPPEGVNSSFYFPNTAPSFAKMLPNVDQSAYSKPPEMKERAEALVKDEPIDITRGDYLVFEGENLVKYTASGLRPATNTRHKRVGQAPSTGYQPEHILASVETVVENPELTLVKTKNETADKPQTGNNIDVGENHADVNHSPQPIPIIMITEDAAVGTHDSSNCSSSSHIQNSSQDTQDPQDTPDSTYLDQSQNPSAQSQVPSGQQTIDPKDLLQPPAPAARKKKALETLKKTTETTPRRSARLAEKKPGPAPATSAPPPVLRSSAKRSHKDDVEDENEDEDEEEEERSGRNKKVISKAAVEKQRETRGKETAKRGRRDRRTALERRGV